jgi:class 3 adenylate cyclase/tetratricopeptide (TPR) repeat protein
MTRCRSCTNDLAEGYKFCPRCGAEQAPACAKCATPLEPGFAFCPKCGAAAAGPPPAAAPAPASRPSAPSERRVVTVMFADVAGFTQLSEQIDPEQLTAMMNQLFAQFAQVVRRYEGKVDKHIGDAMMVLFGAPIAHEDDAERAVLTALEMLAGLPAINAAIRQRLGVDRPLGVHIGVATGLVLAGSVGAGGEASYTVMGDAVNLASRLGDMAKPGEILIAESTRRLVRGRIACELVQTVMVKGKEEPVAVHRVTGRSALPEDGRGLGDFHSPLVGRGAELAVLLQACRPLRRGTGGLLAIQGEAGVGKTRLLRECLQHSEIHALRPKVHTGRCISYGGNVPYFPWSQILSTIMAELQETNLSQEQRAVVNEIISGHFGTRTPAEAERHRSLVFATLPELLRAAAALAPRIIVLEDIHWADATSLELLTALAPSLARAPILLAAVFRRSADSTLLARIRQIDTGGEPAAAIEVRPLDEAATRELALNLTHGIEGLGRERLDEIIRRSGGIPLFVEEILRSYVEAGLLKPEGDHWHFTPGDSGVADSPVPSSLHGLLAAKIDRLPAPLRVRLDIASVIGADFDPHFIEQLVAEPGDNAWRLLELSGEIMAIPGERALPHYRFTHALTQEIVYTTLLKSRRQELHRMIAMTLANNTERLEENLHALAWHFEQADERGRASEYWQAAARQAMSVYANLEALKLFDKAVAAADGAARHAILRGKAGLLRRMGRHAEAVAAIELMLGAAQEERNPQLEVELLCERSMLAYILGDGPGIIRFAQTALARAGETGAPKLQALAWRHLGIGHEFACRYQEAEAAYSHVLEFAVQESDQSLVPGVYNSLGEIARASDRFQEAVDWYGKATAALKHLHPDGRETSYTANLGAAYVGLRDYHNGLACLTRFIDSQRRAGYEAQLSESYYHRGLAYLGLEQIDAAGADAREAARLSALHQEAEMLGLALRLCAQLQARGVPLTAETIPADPAGCLRESVRILEAAGKRGEEARSRWALARVLRDAGRADEARAEFGRTVAIFSELQLDIPRQGAEAELKEIL